MKSLYEGILADIEDTLEAGDDHVTNVMANSDDSPLRKMFQAFGETAFEIEGTKTEKILNVKAWGRAGKVINCNKTLGKVSDTIANISEIRVFGPADIQGGADIDIKEYLAKTIIAPSISVHDTPVIKGVTFSVKKIADNGIPLIQFGKETQKLIDCTIEVEPRTSMPSRAIFTRIPEFKNVDSETVEELNIRYNSSKFNYDAQSFTDSIMANSKLTGMFEYGYALEYTNNKGDLKKIKVKDLSTLKRMAAASDNSFRVYSEWPVRLNANARLSDLIDVSGFKNLRAITISDDKFGICFENLKHPKNQKYGMAWQNMYSMLKERPAIISRRNDTEAMENVIAKIPVTKDGWRVMLCKML
jgi:hypothetical protein